MAVRNVIFDIGNVIISWQPYRALGGLFSSEYEMEQTLQDIGFYAWNFEQDKGRSWEDGVQVVEQSMPEYAPVFKAYRDGLLEAHSQLMPGTSEIIEQLHESGINLYGITNAARESFEAARECAPVIQLFKDVVVSADELCTKPDAEIYQLCLSRNELIAPESLFIDDAEKNCDAARALNMEAHHFTGANALREDLGRHGLL